MSSWLFNLNYHFLQWFGLRLARKMEDNKQIGWTLLTNIQPMSGWNSDYQKWFKWR